VGLRLYAVNFDGTLVDPDGRAFYLKVNPAATESGTLDFAVAPITQTYVNGGVSTEPIDLENVIKANGITSYSFVVKESLALALADVQINGSGLLTNKLGTAKAIQISHIDPATLEDNKATEIGTLKLLNADGTPILSYEVKVTKTLPAFPSRLTIASTPSGEGMNHAAGWRFTSEKIAGGTSRITILPRWYKEWYSDKALEAEYEFTSGVIGNLFESVLDGDLTVTADVDAISIRINKFDDDKGISVEDNKIVISQDLAHAYTEREYKATISYDFGKIKKDGSNHKIAATTTALQPSVRIWSFLRSYTLAAVPTGIAAMIPTPISMKSEPSITNEDWEAATSITLSSTITWSKKDGSEAGNLYDLDISLSASDVLTAALARAILAAQDLKGTITFKHSADDAKKTTVKAQLIFNGEAPQILVDLTGVSPEAKTAIGTILSPGGEISWITDVDFPIKDILGGDVLIEK
jgi:hypothetical protein